MYGNFTINTNYFSSYQALIKSKTGSDEVSFDAKLEETAKKKEYKNAVEDYKKRHPESAKKVDSQVRLGKEVLRKNGAENVDRDSMTMEEYKSFFAGLMNSIPYDWSQARDVNVWTISDKGWEQMKNDPDYEAWVLGYTSEDRSFHNPWAAVPGYSPSFHTERFGASIDEHLGQSMPVESANKNLHDEGETWWEKRQKKMKLLAKEWEEKWFMDSMYRNKLFQINK